MTGMGENEKILLTFLELFPGADTFTLAYRPEKMDPKFRDHRVTASFLQNLPFGSGRPSWYLPLQWGAMRSLDLTPYDLVISLHSGRAKWVSPFVGAIHVCYFLNPLEGLWESGSGLGMRLFGNYLRRCDLKSNKTVTHFLAPSEEMREFIHSRYGRDADVISPQQDPSRYFFKLQVYFRKLYGVKVNEENLHI